MTEPAEITVTAWARLLRAHKTAISIVENALKGADLPPLAWYDVLLELERAKGGGLRPYELQEQLLLPQYGLSRLLNRMAKAGLVEQLPCEKDGRGQRVVVTKEGKAVRRRMWPVYGNAIQNAVGSKLTLTEAGEMATLLKKLF